jgi:hypothetical protein
MSDAAVARCELKNRLSRHRTTLMIQTAVSHAYGWHYKGFNSKADAHSLLTTNTAAHHSSACDPRSCCKHLEITIHMCVSSLQLLQAFGDFQANVVTVYML